MKKSTDIDKNPEDIYGRLVRSIGTIHIEPLSGLQELEEIITKLGKTKIDIRTNFRKMQMKLAIAINLLKPDEFKQYLEIVKEIIGDNDDSEND